MEESGDSSQEHTNALLPGAAEAWFSVLMAHNDDSNARLKASIDDRVRKDAQRKDAAALGGGCAQARVHDQELRNTFELVEETLRNQQAGLLFIKIQSVSDVLLCAGVKRIRHRTSLCRRRFMASCAETSTTAPEANDASLRSASRSQALSTSGSASRLAMRRSRRCERSAGPSFSTSDSKASRWVDMLISDVTSQNDL